MLPSSISLSSLSRSIDLAFSIASSSKARRLIFLRIIVSSPRSSATNSSPSLSFILFRSLLGNWIRPLSSTLASGMYAHLSHLHHISLCLNFLERWFSEPDCDRSRRQRGPGPPPCTRSSDFFWLPHPLKTQPRPRGPSRPGPPPPRPRPGLHLEQPIVRAP